MSTVVSALVRPGSLAGAFALSLLASACAPAQAAPPPISADRSVPMTTSAPVAPAAPAAAKAPDHPFDRRVYRLDFVMAVTDGSAPPVNTAFTLNLGEHDTGEIMVGKNVPLASTGIATPAPRQDVGVKVKAAYSNIGDDLYLDVNLELSSFDPPTTIRKLVEKGNALTPVGKPTLVASLDEDHKHYQLMVTATKLR